METMNDAADRPTTSRRSILRLAAIAPALVTSWPSPSLAQAVDRAVEWARANLPSSTPDIVAGAAREGELVLALLPDAPDEGTRALIRAFNAHYPFVNVSYTMLSSAQALSRFAAELSAKRGVSDYVRLPSDLKHTADHVAAGSLARFVISQDAAFPHPAKLSGFWYSSFRNNGLTAYRVGALSAEEKLLIQTFKGLGDPRFKGRLGMTGASTTSLAAMGSYILMNEPDPSIWQGLAANKPHVKASSTPLTAGLLAGEYEIAVMAGFSTVALATKAGAPIEFGVSAPSPILYAPGAISALAPHPNAAMLWQDWLMSKEGQDLWVQIILTPSARSDVVRSWAEQQPWFFGRDPATLREVNWRDFARKQQHVLARFAADMQGG
jgi:iron(III) transport system substrate-binding protein